MDWSDWFHANMTMPGTIDKGMLLLGSSFLARNTEEELLDENAMQCVWQNKEPKDPLVVNGQKYMYIKDIIQGHEGYSISIYQKLKGDEIEESKETNSIFTARMDTLLWVGTFHKKDTPKVVSFVDSIAMDLFSYIIQTEE